MFEGTFSLDEAHLVYTFSCKVGCIEASSINTIIREENDVHGTGVGYYPGWRGRTAISLLVYLKFIEPQREKTYLLTCAPKEDSNQPA